MSRLFTSESVTEGHPDKICDQISDSILDAMLEQDPHARVAVETMVTTGLVHVAGEVATTGYVEIPSLVRNTIIGIGYDSSVKGFDGKTCGVEISIGEQSADIAQGVDTAYESRTGGVDPLDKQGAGDQGLMFGYACDDTPELMPLPIFLAHRLAERLTAVRKSGQMAYLRPDGKTQVTIGYDSDRPVTLDTVVVSSQHAEDVSLEALLQPDVENLVIKPVLEELVDSGVTLDTSNYRTLVNPTGKFVVGGPMGDAGLTGRKIIVDTYGGMARHGGGAFSGKDPSKVDRSAAYATRWVAKNVVAAGLAKRCEVQTAYAIGKAQPVGLYVETFGTETTAIDAIQKAITSVFDLRPAAIIDELDLLRPIYKATAAYGHFGRTAADGDGLDVAGAEEFADRPCEAIAHAQHQHTTDAAGGAAGTEGIGEVVAASDVGDELGLGCGQSAGGGRGRLPCGDDAFCNREAGVVAVLAGDALDLDARGGERLRDSVSEGAQATDECDVGDALIFEGLEHPRVELVFRGVEQRGLESGCEWCGGEGVGVIVRSREHRSFGVEHRAVLRERQQRGLDPILATDTRDRVLVGSDRRTHGHRRRHHRHCDRGTCGPAAPSGSEPVDLALQPHGCPSLLGVEGSSHGPSAQALGN